MTKSARLSHSFIFHLQPDNLITMHITAWFWVSKNLINYPWPILNTESTSADVRDKHKQSSSHLLLLERWPNGCITSEQEENRLYTTPTASTPSSSRFLWWNRPRPCNWDICRKQVTHSGMCVAWHRPLQLWDWSHSSGFLVKTDRLQASDSSHRNLCLQTDTAETVNQSLFLLRLGLWQTWGRSSCVAAAPNTSFHIRCFNSHSQILKPCFIGNQWPKELKLRL